MFNPIEPKEILKHKLQKKGNTFDSKGNHNLITESEYCLLELSSNN